MKIKTRHYNRTRDGLFVRLLILAVLLVMILFATL
jgi:hypothetical protein